MKYEIEYDGPDTHVPVRYGYPNAGDLFVIGSSVTQAKTEFDLNMYIFVKPRLPREWWIGQSPGQVAMYAYEDKPKSGGDYIKVREVIE